jgi:hypothetical protein
MILAMPCFKQRGRYGPRPFAALAIFVGLTWIARIDAAG